MPKIDLTITISVILALAAIISPIFTAIINNRYQLKLKKLELKQKEYEQTVMYKMLFGKLNDAFSVTLNVAILC